MSSSINYTTYPIQVINMTGLVQATVDITMKDSLYDVTMKVKEKLQSDREFILMSGEARKGLSWGTGDKAFFDNTNIVLCQEKGKTGNVVEELQRTYALASDPSILDRKTLMIGYKHKA